MKKILWGIKKKTLASYVAILSVAFLFAYLTTGIVVRNVIEDNIQEKYQFVNEKSVILLADYFQESNALMEKFIASRTFQDSLRREELSKNQIVELKRELSYSKMSYLERSIYADNKGNIYGDILAGFNKEKFEEWLADFNFEESYSSTKWLWSENVGGLGSGEALYAGRLLRHIDYPLEPGVIILRFDCQLFASVLSEPVQTGVKRFILTPEGEICYQSKEEEVSDSTRNLCRKLALAGVASTSISKEVYLLREDANSGFFIVTVVPKSVMNTGMATIRIYLAAIFAITCGLAYLFSSFFSRRITKPVQQINHAMEQYRLTSTKERLDLNSGTELDTIAQNYNDMVDRISEMMEKIRDDERKMYKLQLDSLMYQINPHFLYNILDNIYMLARLNKNEETMATIQALSDFLRIGLSNENDVITVREEMRHVQNYVEIQKVRNGELFSYEAECDPDAADCPTLKILLQPIVENAIKHGFAAIQSGGLIRVKAVKEGNSVRFWVWNNGAPIDESTLKLLNRIQKEPMENIRSIFQNRSGGYGINSVVKRLRLKYGERFEFYYEDEAGGVSCNIVIPIEDCSV